MYQKTNHFTSVCQIKVTSCNTSKSRHPVRSHCTFRFYDVPVHSRDIGDIDMCPASQGFEVLPTRATKIPNHRIRAIPSVGDARIPVVPPVCGHRE